MSVHDRGFKSMDPIKQREIASLGGRAAHKKGTAHEWNSETARVAGRLGGLRARQKVKKLLQDGIDALNIEQTIEETVNG